MGTLLGVHPIVPWVNNPYIIYLASAQWSNPVPVEINTPAFFYFEKKQVSLTHP